jgi:3-oxoacyl-[acyl-carrier protein] reductase
MNTPKKNVLITGGSKGIGRSIVEEFLQKNYNVYSISRSNPDLNHINFHSIIGDLLDSLFVQELLKKIEDLNIDILVNNAGINIVNDFHEISDFEKNQILTLNLYVPISLCQAVLKNMISQEYGRIINISSIWGNVSRPKRVIYGVSKAGLNGLSKSIAAEYGNKNILANSVSPGFTQTELTKKTNTQKEIEEIAEKIPLKRLASPHEIAKTVEFLASENNTYITGQNIIVDGGFTSI